MTGIGDATKRDPLAKSAVTIGLGERGDNVGERAEVDAAAGFDRLDAEGEAQVAIRWTASARSMNCSPASTRMRFRSSGGWKEVETDEGLICRQPGDLDRHPDAAVLAHGQFFSQQGVDGLDGADLAPLEPTRLVLTRSMREGALIGPIRGLRDAGRRRRSDALDPRLVGELDLEPREVDLRPVARRRLEARFISGAPSGPELAHAVPYDAVAARKAALLELPQQTPGGQGVIGLQPLATKRSTRLGAGGARLVGRRLQPLGDVGPDGLSVDAGLPGDRR